MERAGGGRLAALEPFEARPEALDLGAELDDVLDGDRPGGRLRVLRRAAGRPEDGNRQPHHGPDATHAG
jgi:hypothetical protein